MKLSSRLSSIYHFVDNGIATDVGSDHGKLIISLFKDGKISKGYAIENKIGPFKRLSKAINDENVSKNVIPLFSDGISELPDDTNIVIIAGMGGKTIIDILSSHIEKLKNVNSLVIDAHGYIPEVRKYINSLGYKIDNEEIIFEDEIYYEIIKFVKGYELLSENDIEYGPVLLKKKDELFIKKYQSIIYKINNQLNNPLIPNYKKEELKNKKEKLEAIL